MTREIRRGVVLAIAALLPLAQACADEIRHYDLDSQDAALGLRALALQGDFQVFFPSAQIQGRQVRPVHGKYDAAGALQTALRGTGLTYRLADAGTYVVEVDHMSGGGAGDAPAVSTYSSAYDSAAVRLAQTDGTQSQAISGSSNGGATGAAPTDGSKVEEIFVTGSRIVRKDIEAVSPVSVISSKEIAERGYIRFEEMLNHVPQLVTYQAESGRPFIDLRGLEAKRTLVLVNGRRLAPGGYDSSAADPSLIPPGLIKNVEILTGGASSVYGADAVAGVVNFILDKDFEGFEISTGASVFQHNNRNKLIPPLMDARGENWYAKGNSFDGPQYTFDMMAGGKFDSGRGHITAYLGWDESTLLRMKDRDYTSCALDDTGQCSGSFEAGRPNFYFPGLEMDATLQDDGSLTPWNGNLANWGSQLSMRHPSQRLRAGAFVNYDLNEHAQPYFELNFMRAKNTNYYDQTATFGLPASISCSSPLLSTAQQAEICGPGGLNLGPDDSFDVGIYKRSVESPTRSWEKHYNASRIVAGVQGEITGSWRYDVSFLYGNTSSSERGTNVFSRSRMLNALNVTRDTNGDIVCVSGGNCVPYMVFTPGGITQAALDYLTTDHFIEGKASEYVVNGYLAGDLPLTLPSASSPIAFVFGAEYRKETFEALFDDSQRQGDILGRTQQSDTMGSYNVKDVFTEAVVPLVEGWTLVDSLSAELGYRHSEYDRSGSHDTWKIGLNYRPIQQLKLRGGFNRAVRSPNVEELFSPQSASLWNGADPCAGANPVLTAEQCARTGVRPERYGLVSANPVGQFNMVVGGNPQLQPEAADTWTVGLVASPLERMNVSVDYWDIQIDDVIGLIDPQTALSQCGVTGEAALCSLIHRAADGNLWHDAQSGAGGYVTATNANLGIWHFRGIDTAFDYWLPLPKGELQFRLTGSVFLEKFYENVKGVADSRYTCEGKYSTNCSFPTPRWRHTLVTTYASNSNWTASLSWRYFSAVDNPEVATGLDSGIGSQSYFDLTGTFSLGDHWQFVTGVNNILDKEPPLVSLNLSTNYFNTVDGYYDMLGRYLHASVKVRF